MSSPLGSQSYSMRDSLWSMHSFLMTFVFTGAAIWVAAAAGMLYQVRVANYFAWFYALGAGLTNAIAHFVVPILEEGYFPGLYTAPFHLVASVVLIAALIAESRALREKRGDKGVNRVPIAETVAVS